MRGRRGRPGAVAAAPRHQGRVRPAGTGDVRAYRPVPPAAGRPAQRHAALAGHRRRAGAIGRGAVRDAAGGAHRAAGVREHVRAGILGRPGGRSRPRPGVRRADGGAGLDGGRRGHHRLRLVGRASRRGRRRRHRHAPCRPADQVPHPARHARRPAVLGRGGPAQPGRGGPGRPVRLLPRQLLCPAALRRRRLRPVEDPARLERQRSQRDPPPLRRSRRVRRPGARHRAAGHREREPRR